MLFNSFVFICIFLPLTFLGYYFLCGRHLPVAAKGWLACASLFFYGWWNINYVPLILLSIIVNYLIVQRLGSREEKGPFSRKALFRTGLFFNIGLLGFFKYADFFISNINGIGGANLEYLHIALPLGISFFTLQQITLLVDTNEGVVRPGNFLNHSLFVMFFPQLIAGPIVHHKQMMPQFESLRSKVVNYDNIACGLFVFSLGLFKKTVFADTFSKVVRQAFDHMDSLSVVEAWMASLSYSFQIYFDFSGYSDMAIGLALLFNIALPENFNAPFKAKNLIEFWNRWHITLSLFINAYLYTPIVRALGFSFNKSLLAILLSMFVAGLWHGASWIFVFWGVFHGAGICVNHLWRSLRRPMPAWLAWLLTFNFINISLVFFRSTSFADAFKVLKGMAGFAPLLPEGYTWADLVSLKVVHLGVFGGMPFSDILIGATLFVLGAYVVFFRKSSMELKDLMKPGVRHLVWTAACLCISFLFMNSFAEKEFLYFEF